MCLVLFPHLSLPCVSFNDTPITHISSSLISLHFPVCRSTHLSSMQSKPSTLPLRDMSHSSVCSHFFLSKLYNSSHHEFGFPLHSPHDHISFARSVVLVLELPNHATCCCGLLVKFHGMCSISMGEHSCVTSVFITNTLFPQCVLPRRLVQLFRIPACDHYGSDRLLSLEY